MSSTLRDEEVGREEEGQERAAQLKHVHFEELGSDNDDEEEEDEEEAVTEVQVVSFFLLLMPPGSCFPQ